MLWISTSTKYHRKIQCLPSTRLSDRLKVRYVLFWGSLCQSPSNLCFFAPRYSSIVGRRISRICWWPSLFTRYSPRNIRPIGRISFVRGKTMRRSLNSIWMSPSWTMRLWSPLTTKSWNYPAMRSFSTSLKSLRCSFSPRWRSLMWGRPSSSVPGLPLTSWWQLGMFQPVDSPQETSWWSKHFLCSLRAPSSTWAPYSERSISHRSMLKIFSTC